MSQKDQEPPDNEEDLPNKCPICNEVVEKLVLHISRNKSCYSHIDPELYKKWKLISLRRAKRSYQAKYVKSGWHRDAQSKYVEAGGHKKAQQKYENKFRQRISQNRWGDWKYENEEQRRSFIQVKRQNQLKYLNRKRISQVDHDSKKRLQLFNDMCRDVLHWLDGNWGPYQLNKFHLVEGDFIEEEQDELHAWLKDVDSRLLEMVIKFQKIVQIPKSRWIRVVEKVESKSENDKMKDKLFTLIGKLKSYENPCTRNVSIPDEFKSQRSFHTRFRTIPAANDSSLPKEMELHLCGLIEDILGEDIEELYDLLRLTDMKNVKIACSYAKKSNVD